MAARILVAEDDPKQAELVRRYLEREGHSVVLAADGRLAIDEARRRSPDLLVLDVMMPRVDGLDVCRILRAEADIPIIMLTARSTEDDLLLGLDLGADDYITKPYSPRELVARVRTLLRRAARHAPVEDEPFRIGELVVDPARHEVWVSGRHVDVTPEFKILQCLCASPGRAFTRQYLLEQAFGFDHDALQHTVDVHVMNLRRKIESDPAAPTYLLTVYGVGYKMVELSGRDEVAQLATAFNSMADSIETNETRRRAMVSDVAHELRTPVANVRGYLEAAEDGVVPLDQSLVTSLLEEATLLQRLIDDLQDLALADAGKLRLHPEDTDAAELSRQVAAAHRARADEAGVTLTVDAPEPIEVHSDPVRLRQALGNLVSNAVRHTPAGGSVRVGARRDDGDVVLTVSDTGPGIAAEHLPNLFDRFYRVDESRSRATGGSGLGLAITKQLIEAHGGSIDVISAVGEGSVFSIRLPARQRLDLHPSDSHRP
jgi:signal transduction histidine kinase/FixJ family two-component response regulator